MQDVLLREVNIGATHNRNLAGRTLTLGPCIEMFAFADVELA